MLLIPAIDLKDGKCVRLQQGDMKAVTTFGEDPAAMALRWLEAGARRLHLVDLNGAFAGKPVNLDAKDGKVATDGWSKLTGHEVVDLARKFEDYGVEGVIYTDIGRDGMLTGINVEATVKLAQALSIPVFASGGLSGMSDIEKLCAVESDGIEGVICGRSIYTGALDFALAQQRADELAQA